MNTWRGRWKLIDEDDRISLRQWRFFRGAELMHQAFTDYGHLTTQYYNTNVEQRPEPFIFLPNDPEQR